MTRKDEMMHGSSTCAVFAEYVKDYAVDLGRVLATTRTLLASWALLAAFGAAILLAPALAHGTLYAETHVRHAVEQALAHGSALGHGPDVHRTASGGMTC